MKRKKISGILFTAAWLVAAGCNEHPSQNTGTATYENGRLKPGSGRVDQGGGSATTLHTGTNATPTTNIQH
jgi:hypothetical protein